MRPRSGGERGAGGVAADEARPGGEDADVLHVLLETAAAGHLGRRISFETSQGEADLPGGGALAAHDGGAVLDGGGQVGVALGRQHAHVVLGVAVPLALAGVGVPLTPGVDRVRGNIQAKNEVVIALPEVGLGGGGLTDLLGGHVGAPLVVARAWEDSSERRN